METQPSHIRFSTDVLRRLGEELNPSFDQGVLELVKNSYDADALDCTVTIGSTAVVVEDNGDGMSIEDIESGWLIVGSSRKSQSQTTRLGRIPAGNKGLGRLAALRLGRSVSLTTATRAGQSNKVDIDWRKFDTVDLVDQVGLQIDQAEPRDHGSRIEISSLRRSVGRMDVRRLARAMILLSDPFGSTPSSFNPRLVAPEFDDLSLLVSERYFADAEYHLRAELRSGKLSAEVLDWRGETIFEATHDELAKPRSGRYYDAPDAAFELWSFNLLGSNWVSRASTLGEVREWLREFGGVHVYVDGLRVAPYGNPGNDWLDQNLARARNPEVRPSTNNSIGRVVLSGRHAALQQKTDRSGFIETEGYEELKSFCQDALDWMARRRLVVAEKRRQENRAESTRGSEKSREAVAESIASVVDDNSKRELERTFAEYDRARERETTNLRREVQLYRTLSTAGITAAVFAHESNGNPLKVIDKTMDTIAYRARRGMPDAYDSQLAAQVDRVRRASASLGVLSSATLRIIDVEKRRPGRVDLQEVLVSVVDTFAPFFENRGITVESVLSAMSAFTIGTPAAVESIITNLLNNSVSAVEARRAGGRTIRLTSSSAQGLWHLVVDDNGVGIKGISLSDIWLPGESRRDGGTGLGLTIVKDAVADLGGTVTATAFGDLGGASFEVVLPIEEPLST